MSEKTNTGRGKEMGRQLWVVGLFVVIVIVSAIVWPFSGMPVDESQSIALWIILPALFVVVIAYLFVWWKGWLPATRWGLLNHILPLVFVLLPPLFGFLVFGSGTNCNSSGSGSDDISKFFSPTYYSLMVAVSFTFIVLLMDLESHIGANSERDIGSLEMNRLHFASALSLLVALAAALLYALPYVVELTGQLCPKQQRFLFTFATIAALLAPLWAVSTHARLIGFDRNLTALSAHNDGDYSWKRT
uniref:Uncharacterized protein n=2 Tax=Candidatus Kentrum eta TaxID=2126337 RepID=A0A450U8K3_9GAMM|nr:MAG: hypothetical protein BECKH772A_GA0070896_1000130 [Candidatus Kentron sp. H]VFJ88223.1 MAG: hypothetical protein BECKH772B_GA0070898_1000122 [Candidatus Kentron sp. H]